MRKNMSLYTLNKSQLYTRYVSLFTHVAHTHVREAEAASAIQNSRSSFDTYEICLITSRMRSRASRSRSLVELASSSG